MLGVGSIWGSGVWAGRAGTYSSRTFVYVGLGVSRHVGRVLLPGVGSGQVKQAEVRGRGLPAPLECLNDLTLEGRWQEVDWPLPLSSRSLCLMRNQELEIGQEAQPDAGPGRLPPARVGL